MELTSKNVRDVLMKCFAGSRDIDDLVMVNGITKTIGFSGRKLKEHEDDIISMLMQLPEEFRKSKGGGYSFLAACNTKDGAHWGEHINMEELFILGMGIEKVKLLFPREIWVALPGGVPYYVIND